MDDASGNLHPLCPKCLKADGRLYSVAFSRTTKTLKFRCAACEHCWEAVELWRRTDRSSEPPGRLAMGDRNGHDVGTVSAVRRAVCQSPLGAIANWCYVRRAMRVLLLSMPDSFEHTPTVAVRMPNGALASLAGNLDSHHEVAVADLILAQSSVRRTVEDLIARLRPDLVGLSVMTFQRATARRLIALIRSLHPAVRIVVGGYDPSLAPEAWVDPDLGVDVIVRGEGDVTFREAVRAIENGQPLQDVPGLWFRDGGAFRSTPHRDVARLDRDDIRPPNRAARVLSGYSLMGRRVDVVETSRGCTFDCSFCSIIEMRGRNFHRFPIARVIDDIRDAHAPRCAQCVSRRRQHHARRRTLRVAVPRHHRGRPAPHRLSRPGHDRADRVARRRAGVVDAARRLQVRVPRDRERARGRPGVPEGAREEQPDIRSGTNEHLAGRCRGPAAAMACSSSAA